MVTKMCAIPFLNDLCLDMPQPAASTEMKGPLSHYPRQKFRRYVRSQGLAHQTLSLESAFDAGWQRTTQTQGHIWNLIHCFQCSPILVSHSHVTSYRCNTKVQCEPISPFLSEYFILSYLSNYMWFLVILILPILFMDLFHVQHMYVYMVVQHIHCLPYTLSILSFYLSYLPYLSYLSIFAD